MYDVVIAGGGTAGCAAAYTAGKLGLKVLLLEKSIHLGGTITSGLVIPVMKSGDNQINTDFYNDLIAELQSLGGQLTYQNNSGWFNPELTKIALDNLMQKANVDVRFNASIYKILHKNQHLQTLYINTKILSPYINMIDIEDKTLFEPIDTIYVVDATGNCEIGKILNCNFLNNSEKFQPVSLRFIMSGVNLNEFADWIYEFDRDRDVTTVEHIDGQVHLSTAYTWDTDKQWALAPLFDDAVSKNILKDTDRNYFQVFTVAGMPDAVAFNCPRIPKNINPEDVNEVSYALQEARQAILRLAEFCRIYFPGFKNAYISNIADMLGVRVSNRIKGKYVYTEDDLKSGKKFDNPALISNYPIDVHSSDKNTSTLDKTGEYQVPIEALMSADFDNLFVVGRCLSADYKAQGALRVQASCFSMGEAVAKYIKSNL